MSRRRKVSVIDLCTSSDSEEDNFVPGGAHLFGNRDGGANGSEPDMRSPLKRLRRLSDDPVRSFSTLYSLERVATDIFMQSESLASALLSDVPVFATDAHQSRIGAAFIRRYYVSEAGFEYTSQ